MPESRGAPRSLSSSSGTTVRSAGARDSRPQPQRPPPAEASLGESTDSENTIDLIDGELSGMSMTTSGDIQGLGGSETFDSSFDNDALNHLMTGSKPVSRQPAVRQAAAARPGSLSRSLPAAKPKEESEEAEDATEALHRMLSGNSARPIGGGSLSMSVPAAKPKEESEEAEDATEALHRMLSGKNARPVGGGSLSMSVPAAKPKEESEDAEDATEALHRMLSGNNARPVGGGSLSMSVPAAKPKEESEEAEDATEALHRMLSGNNARPVGGRQLIHVGAGCQAQGRERGGGGRDRGAASDAVG